jgi:nucleoid DNA-binding protein
MTKRDLVVRISNQMPHLRQQDVLQVLQAALDEISDAMARGETVELRNFGVFEVVVRKPRIGRNPNAPASDVRIPPRAVVKFKPGKIMRERVIKLSPEEDAAQTQA